MMILILGGSGSGKSAYAEDYLLRTAGDKKKYYIATMQIWDEEMQAKVARHHRLRQGKGFTTIEQPTALEQAASQMEPEAAVLLECMSNLVANEMFEEQGAHEQTVQEIMAGVKNLLRQADHVVIVTNEIFSDAAFFEGDMDTYLKDLGKINQETAQMADEVVEVVYGIPVYHKCMKKEEHK